MIPPDPEQPHFISRIAMQFRKKGFGSRKNGENFHKDNDSSRDSVRLSQRPGVGFDSLGTAR